MQVVPCHSYSLFTNAGFCSIVAEMYPLSAAHLFEGAGAGVGAIEEVAEGFSASGIALCVCAGKCDNCAMLTPNRAISPLSSLSFLLSAPFLLRKLWCLILPSRISAAPSPSASSGSASARLSRELRVAEDLFAAAPRRRGFEEDLEMREEEEEMRETKEECLMVRLSRLEERKESVVEAFWRKVFWGARGWMELLMRAWRRAVADGFWGAFWIEVSEIEVKLRLRRGRVYTILKGGLLECHM